MGAPPWTRHGHARGEHTALSVLEGPRSDRGASTCQGRAPREERAVCQHRHDSAGTLESYSRDVVQKQSRKQDGGSLSGRQGPRPGEQQRRRDVLHAHGAGCLG